MLDYIFKDKMMLIRLNLLTRIIFFEDFFRVYLGTKKYKFECDILALEKIKNIYQNLLEDGYYTPSEADIESLKPFLEMGIFVNEDNYYFDAVAFHDATTNPSIFHPLLSSDEINEILRTRQLDMRHEVAELPTQFSYMEHRRSTREELSQKKMKMPDVEELLKVAYGTVRIGEDNKIHKTVASAGAMFPLELFYIDFKRKELFVFDGVESIFIREVTNNEMSFARNVNKMSNLSNWKGVVLIFASLEAVSEKYGPKGYVFSLLESGSVIQNMAHYITLGEYSMLTVGCLVDREAINVVGLNPVTNILTVGALVR